MSRNRKYETSFETIDEAVAASNDKTRVCPECARYFVPWRHDQFRCGKPCTKTHWARNQARGTVLLPLAMEWRISRGKMKDKLADMCHLLDGWHHDDSDRNKKYEAAVEELKRRRKK